MCSPCPCGFPPGSLVPSHLPKYAGRWFGYTRLSLDVNECANMCCIVPCGGQAPHPGYIPALCLVFPG